MNVLLLCTHNSARSIVAEATLNATAHWGYPDPSEVQGSEEERRAAFRSTLHAIRNRIQMLVSLPADRLDKLRLQQTARELASR